MSQLFSHLASRSPSGTPLFIRQSLVLYIKYIWQKKPFCWSDYFVVTSLSVAIIPLCIPIFTPLLLFYELIEKSCHLSHCCSRQQGQVEEFALEEQCSRGVLKQRRRFWRQHLASPNKEIASTKRRSGQVQEAQLWAGSQSARRGGRVQAGGGFLWLFWTLSTCVLPRFRLIREKTGARACLIIRDDDDQSGGQWLFTFLC